MKVQFRDGEREVPDHVAALLSGIETYKLTFDQAMVRADEEILAERLRAEQQRIITEHFKTFRR